MHRSIFKRMLRLTALCCTVMLMILVLVFVMGAASAATVGQYLYKGDPEASSVIEVTSERGFFVSSTSPRVVEFYSPYCGHCRHFKPKYIKFANELKGTLGFSNVEFYAVSCAAHSDICQKYKIRSYPSVFTVEEGKSVKSVDDMKALKQGPLLSAKKIAKQLGLKGGAAASNRKLEDEEPEDSNKEEEEEEEEKEEEEPEDPNEEYEEEEEMPEKENGKEEEEETMPVKENGEEEEKEENETLYEEPENPSEQEEFEGGEEFPKEESFPDETEEELEDENREPEDSFTESIMVQPKRAGAEVARDKERDMDQWQREQQQRIAAWKKKRLRKRRDSEGQIFNPGATTTMRAHQKGTLEFRQRHEEVLAKLEKMNRRKIRQDPRAAERVRSGKPVFQKKLRRPRIVEHIPGVKRMVRMSAEEELILDASLSFREGLKYVFKSEDPLPTKEKQMLRKWLQLLTVSIPPEWGLRETVASLLRDIEFIAKSPRNLKKAVKEQKFPRKKWSKSCRKGEFTCGFWKLLHISTVGVAENRGGLNLKEIGLISQETPVFSPLEAADTIRDYMKYFFPCTECSEHFQTQYNDCSMNRRCDRLTDDALSATDADWKELGLWLWEFHNVVSVRLLNENHDDERKRRQNAVFFKEKAGPGAADRQEEVKALWPTLDGCIVCFSEDGRFNEDAIFLHLEKTYWPGYNLKDTPRRLIFFEGESDGALVANAMLLIVGMLLVLIMRNRITRASVQSTVLRARTMGNRVAHGKIRTI